jgi:ATP synthase protein I
MADDAREDPAKRPTDEALSARLRRLGEQLGREGPSDPPETDRGRPAANAAGAAGFAQGFRLSTELVAGVLVGAAIGWALDRLIGTSPLGLIVFLSLGFAAGVVNVIRAAGIAPGAGRDNRT